MAGPLVCIACDAVLRNPPPPACPSCGANLKARGAMRRVVDEPIATEPPGPVVDEPVASLEARRRILRQLVDKGGSKYKTPFTTGSLASISFAGGTWNEYADVVLDIVMADTMLNVETQLGRVIELLEQLAKPT